MSTTDSPLLTTESENTKTTTTAFVATKGENKKWKVIYFDFPARGEQLRLMFIYSKVDFIDERYKGGKLLAGIKKNVMGDASPLPYDQVPVLVSPDSKAYGQLPHVCNCLDISYQIFHLEIRKLMPPV